MSGGFLRVMTYNIHGGLDRRGFPALAQIGLTIEANRPGLIGLQEVERSFRARTAYADQAALLAGGLGSEFRFAAAIDLSPARSGGKFGNCALSSWPVTGSWALHLPCRGEPRVLLGLRVQTPFGLVNFLVCHLGLDRAERQRQVEAILRRAETLRGPLILAGDLNALPDADELGPLLGAWQEVQTACGRNEPTFPPGGERIDYIFFSRDWRILRVATVHSSASDHWPLVADLAL